MRCCYLIPTANPPLCATAFVAWRLAGWDTFALLDGELRDARIEHATGIFRVDRYEGWGSSFNLMASDLWDKYDWMATGGDDVYPPQIPASVLGRELTDYFGGTFGVCQGTADGWAWDKNGTVSPICYAPIIGAEFCRRWNGGKGAFWTGYHSYFADNELHDTSAAAGLLWARPDLMLEHRHPAKSGRPTPAYKVEKQPLWQADHDLYHSRRRDGFPGHTPAVS